MRSSICITLALAAHGAAQDNSLAAVKAAFDDAQIPEDLRITFDPSILFEVSLPQADGSSLPVTANAQVARNATIGPPQFAFRGGVAPDQRFVIATVDPDAPTPESPTEAQIRHFLGGDFVPGKGMSEGTGLVNLTAPISSWLQPAPPPGSPAHRHIFLLFNQSATFDEQTLVTANSSRLHFNISSFAQSVGLGNPIAGTFMRVAPDSSD